MEAWGTKFSSNTAYLSPELRAFSKILPILIALSKWRGYYFILYLLALGFNNFFSSFSLSPKTFSPALCLGN